MDEKRVGELVEHFYRGFLAADREALAEVVDPEAAWIVRLDTVLSGAHVAQTASRPWVAKYLHDPAAFESFWSRRREARVAPGCRATARLGRVQEAVGLTEGILTGFSMVIPERTHSARRAASSWGEPVPAQ